MKSIVASFVFVTMIAWACRAQSQPAASEHKPNAGYVSDAQTAEDIGRFILSVTLTPDDKHERTVMHNVTLKDGVWTVQFSGPKTGLAIPIVIQIRQTTGAIIKYEDPDA